MLKTGMDVDCWPKRLLANENLIFLDCDTAPRELRKGVKLVTMEFAGVKFKVHAESGVEYIRYVQNCVIKPLTVMFPHAGRFVLCEEKYSFTPDDFKAATRNKRQAGAKSGIVHLHSPSDILSDDKFDREAITGTSSGKQLISEYLAANATRLSLKNVTLDIDSELHLSDCICDEEVCKCSRFAIPVRCTFNENGQSNTQLLHDTKQRKGEAEMSQVDWVVNNMSAGENIVSVVTSGDIDAVIAHIFAISLKCPRRNDGSFPCEVHVFLQKPGRRYDIYNVTSIIHKLEHKYGPQGGVKAAAVLCMGGNDFLPGYFGISHLAIASLAMNNAYFCQRLISVRDGHVTLNTEIYLELIKFLYCPKRLNAAETHINDVRIATIQTQKAGKLQCLYRNPQLWMPPVTALVEMAKLTNLQLSYLMTAGDSEAVLPDFLAPGCLVKSAQGNVSFYLGPHSHVEEAAIIRQASQKRPAPTTSHNECDTKRRRITKRKLNLS